MSKSMTEKELAKKLGYKWSTDESITWADMARHAAELLGVTLTPEEPEPGTWHIVKDGPYVNRAAYVNGSRSLLIFADNGDYDGLLHDGDWPALTPARVVPAELVELTKEEVGKMFETARGDHWLSWDSWTDTSQGIITATVNAALAKHGRGRVEVSREQIRKVLEESWTDWTAVNVGPTLDLHADAVMELLEGSK